MAKMGRPTDYTPKLVDEFLERIAGGEKITHICRDDHMPAAKTIYRWEAKYEEFCQAFARARDKACDAISYEAIEIADNQEIDPAHKRVMVDTRLKLLGMWSNRYSAKQSIDHTTKGEKVQNVQSLSTADLEAIIAKGAK